MNTLYLDCSMGAAGDMLTAALLELLPDRAGFLRRLNGLGLPGVAFRAEPGERCGIRGTHITVTVHGVAEDGGGMTIPTNTLMHTPTTIFMPTATGTPLWRISPV